MTEFSGGFITNGQFGFSGVCVKSCPKRNDWVIRADKNLTAAYDTQNLFYRCLDSYTWRKIPAVQCYRWKDKAGREYTTGLSASTGTCKKYADEYHGGDTSLCAE